MELEKKLFFVYMAASAHVISKEVENCVFFMQTRMYA